jgi:hypothetical protein
MFSIIDNYIESYSGARKEMLLNYYKQYGFPCEYLRIDESKNQEIIETFGSSRVGFDLDGLDYQITHSHALIEVEDFYRTSQGSQIEAQLYIPDLEIGSGDRLRFIRNGRQLVYTIQSPTLVFYDIFYRVDLTLTAEKKVEVSEIN